MNTFYDQVQAAIPRRTLYPRPSHVYIDEWPCRLHYRATTIVMLICVGIVNCSEYFGSRIHCLPVTLSSQVIVSSKFLETYCFIRPTFTVHPLNSTGGQESDLVAGGPQSIPGKNKEMYHAYYQWIPFVLFFQAFLFYMPHHAWKHIESNRLKYLLQGLHIRNLNIDASQKLKAIKALGKYIWDSRNCETAWSVGYLICEYSNLAVVVLNIYLTDLLLGNHFISFGIDLVNGVDEEDTRDLTETSRKLFPKVSKCNFQDFGASGSIQILSTTCILPLNVVNERVFTFLWFWYIFLGFITGTFQIYRTATLFSFRVRRSSIMELGPNTKYTHVLEKLGFKGFILLKLLSLNLEETEFQTVVLQVYEELSKEYRAIGSVE